MGTKEIIDGLKFTVEMCLFDPSTGEVLTENQLNEDNRTTVDACNGAIKALQKLQAIEEQEPCGDAISRKDLMHHLYDCKTENAGIIQTVIVAIESYVELMPTVTPIRPKGKWKKISFDKYVQHAVYYYRCSECGNDIIGEFNYCPNCGADMMEDNNAD